MLNDASNQRGITYLHVAIRLRVTTLLRTMWRQIEAQCGGSADTGQ
jgi:hypothetical protein